MMPLTNASEMRQQFRKLQLPLQVCRNRLRDPHGTDIVERAQRGLLRQRIVGRLYGELG